MSLWNKYHENLVKKWSSMAKTYSIMHSSSSQYYSKWDKRLTVPVILLGAVTASSIFSSGTTSTEDAQFWNYVNGAMALTMTGLSGVSKFLGTHEKQVKHTSAAFKYTQISMNIDTVLSFPRDQREEMPRQFINEMKMAILEVREHSPNLPTWIIESFIKMSDKTITNTTTNVNRRTTPDTMLKKLDDVTYHSSERSSSESGNNLPNIRKNSAAEKEIKKTRDIILRNTSLQKDKLKKTVDEINEENKDRHTVIFHDNLSPPTNKREHHVIDVQDFKDNQSNAIAMISHNFEHEVSTYKGEQSASEMEEE